MNFTEYKHTVLSKCCDLNHFEKVTVGLICCNWLGPLYSNFSKQENWGDEAVLTEIRELIFSWLQGRSVNTGDLLKRIEKVTPDTEEFGSVAGSLALNSSIAHAYSLELLHSDDEQTLCYVLQHCYDTIDFCVQEILDPTGANCVSEELIESHDLMRTETTWQFELIKEVKGQPNLADLIEKHKNKKMPKIA